MHGRSPSGTFRSGWGLLSSPSLVPSALVTPIKYTLNATPNGHSARSRSWSNGSNSLEKGSSQMQLPLTGRRLRKRTTFIILVIILGFVMFIRSVSDRARFGSERGEERREAHFKKPTGSKNRGLEVDYAPIFEYEKKLSQLGTRLNPNRYVKFTTVEIPNGSIDEQLQHLVLLSHLAYMSDRTFAFPSIRQPSQHSNDKSQNSNQLIPLNALISSPTSGLSVNQGALSSFAIPEDQWDAVCPKERTTSVLIEELGPETSKDDQRATQHWADALREIPSDCVEIRDAKSLFDQSNLFKYLSSSVLNSPVFYRFAWSSLVYGITARNFHLVRDPHSIAFTSSEMTRDSIVDGLIAIHVPSLDFASQCAKSAKLSQSFYGFNQMSELPDPLLAPSTGLNGLSATQALSLHNTRCSPTVETMKKRIRQVLDQAYQKGGLHVPYDRLFVITSDGLDWIKIFKNEMLREGWNRVITSSDLLISHEEKDLHDAVNIQIASRAQVFIGNGFSSMSSMVTMVRMGRNIPPIQSRIW